MKLEEGMIIGLLALIAISNVRILPDPYYHQTLVTWPEWISREIDELIHGEAIINGTIVRPNLPTH